MFIGEFNHTIDPKGRVAIPFRFRSDLGSGAVITRSIEKCLVIYTREEWEKVAQKLTNLPMFDAKARAVSRFIFAGAAQVEFDKQGRALIPAYLRDYAGLKKDVMLAGLFNKIEIWDESTWTKNQAKTGIGTDDFDQQLKELGI
jgi:MraZ protein